MIYDRSHSAISECSREASRGTTSSTVPRGFTGQASLRTGAGAADCVREAIRRYGAAGVPGQRRPELRKKLWSGARPGRRCGARVERRSRHRQRRRLQSKVGIEVYATPTSRVGRWRLTRIASSGARGKRAQFLWAATLREPVGQCAWRASSSTHPRVPSNFSATSAGGSHQAAATAAAGLSTGLSGRDRASALPSRRGQRVQANDPRDFNHASVAEVERLVADASGRVQR